MPEIVPKERFEWERLIRRAPLSRAVKGTALFLATYADTDGSRVRPGVTILANVCCCHPATIKRHLAALREGGYIERTKQGNRYANQADEYRLTIPAEFPVLAILSPQEEVYSAPMPPRDAPQTSRDDLGPTESMSHPGESMAQNGKVYGAPVRPHQPKTNHNQPRNVTFVNVSHERATCAEQPSIRPGDPSYQPVNTAYAAFRAALMERKTS